MGLRITQNLLADRTLSNLNAQLRRLAKAQEQLTTGRRVNRPSDDPIDARRAVNTQTRIGENEQFSRNISDVGPQLTETATTLLRVLDIIQRTRDLTLQGANGTIGQAQLDQIALEIDQLLEALVVSGNHQTNGRFIFGGTRTLSPAFTVTRVAGDITAVTAQGNTLFLRVSISRGITVNVNEPGIRAFQGTVDMFQLLIDIRDDMRAGNRTALQGADLANLDLAQDQILLSVARVGSLQNRLERVSADTEDFILQLQEVLSDRVDADFAEAMINFNSLSNGLQAALNAAARVLQPSLLDFIR